MTLLLLLVSSQLFAQQTQTANDPDAYQRMIDDGFVPARYEDGTTIWVARSPNITDPKLYADFVKAGRPGAPPAEPVKLIDCAGGS